MPHPYSTRARLDELVGAGRVSALLDRNEDGLEDVGVLDDLFERAANQIDARLAKLYVVPFSSPTPGLVADVCDYYTASLLYITSVHPDAAEVEKYEMLARRALDAVLLGKESVPGATPIPADQGPTVGARARYGDRVYAGTDCVGGRRVPRSRGAF